MHHHLKHSLQPLAMIDIHGRQGLLTAPQGNNQYHLPFALRILICKQLNFSFSLAPTAIFMMKTFLFSSASEHT